MPWSGGIYTRTNGQFNGDVIWQTDALGDIKIESDRHDTHDQDLADGINACLNRDGSNKMTGALDMNGFQITNVPNLSNGNVEYALLTETISALLLSSNKILTAAIIDLADVTVDLTPVMDGAGVAIQFDTGTNLLSLNRQNGADSIVNLSTLAGTVPGWGAPETDDFIVSPGNERTVDTSGGTVTATVAPAISAGDVFTLHNASTGLLVVDLLTNGYTLAYGGDTWSQNLNLRAGDTLTCVALSPTVFEVI